MSPMSVRPEIHFADTQLARYDNLADHVLGNISIMLSVITLQYTNYPFGYSIMLQMVSEINRSSSTWKNRRFCSFTQSARIT